MTARPPTLMALADEFLAHNFAPNPAEPPSVVLSSFVLTLQDHGGDLGAWPEGNWVEVLEKKFGYHEDYIADGLESIAAWGVVDNYEYTPQGLADAREVPER